MSASLWQCRPAFPAIVAALEYIIVDTGILDNHGRKLWKDYFLKKVRPLSHPRHLYAFHSSLTSLPCNQDKVGWTDFLRVFMNIMPSTEDPQTRILNIKCLYALLGTPPT
jgi:hypothetical protein